METRLLKATRDCPRPRGSRVIGPTDSITRQNTSQKRYTGVAGRLTRHFVTTKQMVSKRTNPSPTLAEQKATTGPVYWVCGFARVRAVFAAHHPFSLAVRRRCASDRHVHIFAGRCGCAIASQTSVSTQQFSHWDPAGLLAAIGMIVCAWPGTRWKLARPSTDAARP